MTENQSPEKYLFSELQSLLMAASSKNIQFRKKKEKKKRAREATRILDVSFEGLRFSYKNLTSAGITTWKLCSYANIWEKS